MIRRISLVVLVTLLQSQSAWADGFPVVISAGSLHYRTMDQSITTRLAQVLARNSEYKLLQKRSLPYATYLINYTDLDNGLVAMSTIVIWEEEGQRFPAFLVSGVTFCTVQDQSQCILDATTILQEAYNNYHHPQLVK